LDTGDRPIVEESRRDDFWGAKPVDECTLVGMNVLGRLLMELREAVKTDEPGRIIRVEPRAIADFKLDGRAVGVVTGVAPESRSAINRKRSVQGRLRRLRFSTSLNITGRSIEAEGLASAAPASDVCSCPPLVGLTA